MIKTEIRNKINFPKVFIEQSDLMEIAERIIITDIQKGIHSGMAIDGGSLPMNDPKTIKRKQGIVLKRIQTKKGNIKSSALKSIEVGGLSALGGAKTLIDTGKLLVSFSAVKRGKNNVIIKIGSDRKDIAGYLQIDGIKTNQGLKFYKFFGISKDAENLSIGYIQDKIKKAIDNARQ